MEIVTIEATVFESMLEYLENAARITGENGTLAYSRISHKVYYRPEDIQKILSAIQKRKGGQI